MCLFDRQHFLLYINCETGNQIASGKADSNVQVQDLSGDTQRAAQNQTAQSVETDIFHNGSENTASAQVKTFHNNEGMYGFIHFIRFVFY